MTFFPPDTLLILPGRLAVNQERMRLLDQDSAGVVLNPRLYTFDGLLNFLAGELDFQAREISAAGADMLLDSLLAGDEYLNYWPGFKSGPGLRLRILNLINYFKECGITCGQLKKIGIEIDGGPHWDGLAGLYEAYERSLRERGLVDRGAGRFMVIESLAQGRSFEFLRAITQVFIKGFRHLTPLQVRTAKALNRMVERVEITLTCPDWIFSLDLASESAQNLFSLNPFQETLALIKELESSEQEGRGLDLKFQFPAESGDSPLSWLAGGLFNPGRPPGVPPDCSGRLEVLGAPGRYQEVEAIARRASVLLGQGTAPERIAVAFRDLGVYAQLVEDVFRRFNLPFRMRRGEPLHIQAPVRVLRTILSLAGSHFDRDMVLDLFTSPYLDFGLKISAARAADLAYKAGVTDERAGVGWERNLKRLAENNPGDKAEADLLLECFYHLQRLIAPLSGPQTWGEFEENTRKLFQELKVLENIRAGGETSWRRDIPALEGLFSCLEEMRQAAKDAGRFFAHQPDELAAFLTRALAMENRSIGLNSADDAGIMILKVDDLEGLDFDCLFLGGLNEGEWPAVVIADSLIPDSRRRALNRLLGRTVLNTSGSDYRREELLFFHALLSTRNFLGLSYCTEDEQGRTRLPSALVDDILRLWPGDGLPVKILSQDLLPPLEDSLAEDEIIAGIIWRLSERSKRAQAEKPLAEEVLSALLERPGWAERWASLAGRSQQLRTGPPVYIQPASLEPWLKTLRAGGPYPRLSPTVLEDYGRCPFYFWAGRVLKLVAVEEIGEEISAMDEGNITHRIISGFFQQCREKQGLPLKGEPWEEELLLRSAGRILDQAEKVALVGRTPLWTVRRAGILRLLKRWLADEQADQINHPDRTPALFEWRFDQLEIPLLKGGSLLFQGRVDRVDMAAGESLAIDYKLSANTAKHRRMLKPEFMGRLSFQAPIYQLAALREYHRPAWFTYYLLRELNRLKPVISTEHEAFARDEESRLRMNRDGRLNFYNNLEETWARLTAGDFNPGPDEGACEYCPFRLSCRQSESGEEA